MILSLNENRKPKSINEMVFNEGLAMFDKEMEVFLYSKRAEGKNTRT